MFGIVAIVICMLNLTFKNLEYFVELNFRLKCTASSVLQRNEFWTRTEKNLDSSSSSALWLWENHTELLLCLRILKGSIKF